MSKSLTTLRQKERALERAQQKMATVSRSSSSFARVQASYFQAKAQLYYARAVQNEGQQSRHWMRRALAIERTYRVIETGGSDPDAAWLLSPTIAGMVGVTFARPGDGKPARVVAVDTRRRSTHVIVECGGVRRSTHRMLIRAAITKNADAA